MQKFEIGKHYKRLYPYIFFTYDGLSNKLHYLRPTYIDIESNSADLKKVVKQSTIITLFGLLMLSYDIKKNKY